MSRVSRRRSLVARIVAPLLGVACVYATSLASDGGYYNPYPHAMPVVEACPPVIECCPPTNSSVIPSLPTEFQTAPIESSSSDIPIEPTREPSFSAASEPVPLPAAPETNPAPNFDLSRGLATNFGSGRSGSLAFADSIVAPGYIESAVIQSRIRFRYDDAQGANASTRAGFFYPVGLFLTSGGLGGGRGPSSYTGADTFQDDVDLKETSAYLEAALSDVFSIFINVPYRDVFVPNTTGPALSNKGGGDIQAGFRLGLLVSPEQHLTFQVRTWVPTGNARQALGTGNTAIDLGLLYSSKISDRLTMYAELNDWQTLDAVTLTDPSNEVDPDLLNQNANILRYGLGFGVKICDWSNRCRQGNVTFLTECVGWTVLDGVTAPLSPSATPLIDATGDTIINGKYGARVTHGKNSAYVGYGHNWTQDRWYSDLLRVEFQRVF